MGTLLPILVSLGKANKISLTSTLVFGGIFNIMAGFYFRIPLCVQPMKAIAAVAISTPGLTENQLLAAGFTVSLIVLVLSITRTLHLLHRLLPHPLIRGIQLGTGLQFVNKGVASLIDSHGYAYAGSAFTDNYLTSVMAFVGCMLSWKLKRNPAAVGLVVYGVVVAAVLVWGNGRGAAANGYAAAGIGPSFGDPRLPSGDDFRVGILNAGLGQLPLTILNSIIATSKLADDLFPDKPHPVASVTAVGMSVGFMNVIGMWFGSVPYCHGSGGLAGQYRFGARTHVSVVLLGIFKLAIGLAFGSALLPVFQAFPHSILGVMLILAGVELGNAARDVGGTDSGAADRFLVTLITGSVVSAWANDGIGFAAGSLAYCSLWIARRVESGESVPGALASGLREMWDMVRDGVIGTRRGRGTAGPSGGAKDAAVLSCV
ncbi:hypothetical protein DFJ73DRAFT_903118 [Zopfochytrium polystomum]|nr:hypothetical protein DFJ73DRAFT_903118 [Zopfochytrium polystomum]